jgi:hypothetical protein
LRIHPRPIEVIRYFLQMLENIFRDPLQNEIHINPVFLQKSPPEIVHFMFNKMRDRHSFFYSEQLTEVLPMEQIAVVPNLIREPFMKRRIEIELAEIEAELAKCDLKDPMIKSLLAWHREFQDHLQPNKELYYFQEALAKIFKEHLFPALNEGEPVGIVLFMVKKMRDQGSLFYSKLMDQPQPKKAPPMTAAELKEKMRRINAIQAERTRQEEAQMPDLQAFKDRVKKGNPAKNHKSVDAVDRRAQQEFAEVAESLKEMRTNRRHDNEKIRHAAKKLKEEVADLHRETDQLKVDIAGVKQGISELDRAQKELQVSINKVQAEIKEKQSNWLIQLAALAASVALSCAFKMPITIIAP